MKIKKKVKRIKKRYNFDFVGRQLSRLKQAQNYYTLIMSTVSAVSLLRLAFSDELPFVLMALLVPITLFLTYLLGYYLDVKDVLSIDTLKTNEINQRYINTTDQKNQEFQIVNTFVLITALEKIQKGEYIDKTELMENYSRFYDKWKHKLVGKHDKDWKGLIKK